MGRHAFSIVFLFTCISTQMCAEEQGKTNKIVDGLLGDNIVIRDKSHTALVDGGRLPSRVRKVALLSPQAELRRRAMRAVCDFVSLEATLTCTAALSDSNGDVVYLAIVGLEHNRHLAHFSSDCLVKLLQSGLKRQKRISPGLTTEQFIACDSADALGLLGYGSDLVVTSLLEIARTPRTSLAHMAEDKAEIVGSHAAFALINLGKRKEGVHLALGYLASQNPIVREESLGNLLLLKEQESNILRLVRELKSNDPSEFVRDAAESVLEVLGDGSERVDDGGRNPSGDDVPGAGD